MYFNARRLFVASCLALITSAFSFQMRQNIGDDIGIEFRLTKEMIGAIMGGQFFGMAMAMLVFSPLCDALGMGRVLGLAWVAHLTGISGTIFAQEIAGQAWGGSLAGGIGGLSSWFKTTIHVNPLPDVGADHTAFWVLWLAAFIVGCGNGLLEVAINPLAATLYPQEKTHKLNVLHAWWPGGLIVAGLMALYFVNPLYGKEAEMFGYTIDPAKLGLADMTAKVASWRFKYALVYIPMLLYGVLAVGQKFPQTERVQAQVSFGTMALQMLRPLFIVWVFCMMLTASTELATNAWMEPVLTRTANVSGTLVFVFITLLMFVLRFFAGPIAHAISPIGILFFGSIFTAAGLYWLSIADTRVMAFAAAAVFALGITYYWPTMLGVTAERFPKGGALLLGLMGFVGNLMISQTTPMLGAIFDSYTAYNVPARYQDEMISTAKSKLPVLDKAGKPVAEIPLITDEAIPTWIPPQVTERIYPAGGKKVDPVAFALIKPDKKAGEEPSELYQSVEKAEVEGARWAFRWTTVLPLVLIVIFGLVALYDFLRGGYKAERINEF
jgi:MFS family permease